MNSSSSSSLTFFVLRAYMWIGPWRYPCFLLALLLYVIILSLNALLVALVCLNRTLHKPMYLFLCSLLANQIYGSSSLFPLLLLQLLKEVHTIPTSMCFLQIFCLYTYASVEFYNLSLMAYDRYLAICSPLKYGTYMSDRRVLCLIVCMWSYCFVRFTVGMSLTIHLTFCGNSIDSIYCNNYLVTRLACCCTQAVNIYGLLLTAECVVAPLSVLLFSYGQILRVCFRGSGRTRRKAMSTCVPHLLSLLNFCFGSLLAITQGRADFSEWPGLLRVMLSLYCVVMQPLLYPLLYGLQLTRIRNTCYKLLCPQCYANH